MQIPLSSIKGTIGLIIINIIVFIIFGFTETPTSYNNTLECLRDNHPECLTLAPMDSTARCITSNPGGNHELCIYNLKSQCQNNPVILKACYPEDYIRVNDLSFVPALFANGEKIYTVITSMFMHADFDHLWGNMIFLFLVGIFIERRLGTAKFLLFYLLVGIGGTLFFFIFNQSSQIALIGASGAISGLMGANLILDFFKSSGDDIPYFKAQTLIIFIVYQFLFQMIDTSSRIAYLGHIGGFITGIILIFYFKKKNEVYIPTPTY